MRGSFVAVCLLALSWPSGVRAQALSAEVLARTKAGTVFLRVVDGRGQESQGSGFFVAPGLIVTNAHVLGMDRFGARPPQRVQATLHSGISGREATVGASYAGADPDWDLAFLRCQVEQPPEPLPLADARALAETQPIHVLGFPFGDALARLRGNPPITVSGGTISSLGLTPGGELRVIQIDANINPGNSGGPVIDPQGRVVGVAVSTITGTTISFTIPCNRVDQDLLGRATGIHVLERRATTVDVRVQFVDPQARVRGGLVSIWSQQRSAEPKPDSRVTTRELRRGRDGSYVARLNLPRSPQQLWLEARAERGGERLDPGFVAPLSELPTAGAVSSVEASQPKSEPKSEAEQAESAGEPAHQTVILRERQPLALTVPPTRDVVYLAEAEREGLVLLDPATLAVLGELELPAQPLRLWSDDDHIYVVCRRLGDILQVDLESGEVENRLSLRDDRLDPVEIVGATRKGLYTIWRGGDGDEVHLFRGRRARHVLTSKRQLGWVIPLGRGEPLTQGPLDYSPGGKIGRGGEDFARDQRPFEGDWHASFGRGALTRSGKLLALSRERAGSNSHEPWTYLVTRDLRRIESAFPGALVDEPEEGVFVTWGRFRNDDRPRVLYVRGDDGEVLHEAGFVPRGPRGEALSFDYLGGRSVSVGFARESRRLVALSRTNKVLTCVRLDAPPQ